MTVWSTAGRVATDRGDRAPQHPTRAKLDEAIARAGTWALLRVPRVSVRWSASANKPIAKLTPNSVELPGIEPDALPGLLPPELGFGCVSFQFSSTRYLRFRSRVLTASRASAWGRAFHEARDATAPVRRSRRRGGPRSERGAGSGAAFVFGSAGLVKSSISRGRLRGHWCQRRSPRVGSARAGRTVPPSARSSPLRPRPSEPRSRGCIRPCPPR